MFVCSASSSETGFQSGSIYRKRVRTPLSTTTTTTPMTSGTNPDIPNPEPYQYDPVTNQYYHPDHKHWHSGTPPADKTAGASATVQTEVQTEGSNP